MKLPQDKQITLQFSLFKLLERLLFIGLIFYFVNNWLQSRSQINEITYMNEAIRDSLHTYINKYNEKISKTKIIATTDPDLFLSIKSQNKEIKRLQYLVKQYRKEIKHNGAIITAQSITKISDSTKTQIDSTGLNYTAYFKNKWYEAKCQTNKDSSKLDFKTFNDIYVVFGDEKKHFWQKSKPYALINDKNPYSTIKSMKVYRKNPPRPKKLGLGVHFGYDPIDNKPNFSLGLNYNFVELW